jgi:GDSL-like Lipase/Acylhydrolase family
LISALEAALDSVRGALETVSDESGTVFHRVPAAGRSRLIDPGIEQVSSTPSGVRLEVLTDASHIELDVALTHVIVKGTKSTGSVFDVVIDGRLCEPLHIEQETLNVIDLGTFETHVVDAAPARVRIQLGSPAVERHVVVWLPHASALRLVDVRIPEGADLRAAPQGRPLWVHHGSSISQGSQADRPTETWPAIAALGSGQELLNLGVGGQCQLDHFMARAIRDTPASTISLEIGINLVNGDTMRERVFVSAFHGFLDVIREGQPHTPIVVVTPFICPAVEEHPGPTPLGRDLVFRAVERPAGLAEGALSLSRMRALLHEHVALRRAEGDTRIHVVDGLDLFGRESIEDLPDGLHPNARGQRQIGGRFLELVFRDGGPCGLLSPLEADEDDRGVGGMGAADA